MVEQRLEERLRAAEPPDADGAQRRAWAVVTQVPLPARRRRRRRVAMLLATAAGAAAFALTPPGLAVGDWVRERIAPPRKAAPPALVPGDGRLLVAGAEGVSVASAHRVRRLGGYDGAVWSPRGLFVAAWAGRELRALEPDGDRRWLHRAPGRIVNAAWSPSGYRIAYFSDPGGVNVVAGDGTGAHPYGPRARSALIAFRPGAPQTLASIDRRWRIDVRDVDTGALVWRSSGPLGRGARAVTWSADGRRLAVATRQEIRVVDLSSRRVTRRRARGIVDAAYAPRGTALAVLSRGARGSVLRVGDRQVLATQARLDRLVWSPDARELLLAGEQWLTVRRGRIAAVATPRGEVLGWAFARSG